MSAQADLEAILEGRSDPKDPPKESHGFDVPGEMLMISVATNKIDPLVFQPYRI